jgi:polysaccharide export outer membrane protein
MYVMPGGRLPGGCVPVLPSARAAASPSKQRHAQAVTGGSTDRDRGGQILFEGGADSLCSRGVIPGMTSKNIWTAWGGTTVNRAIKWCLLGICLAVLSGCALPRGAALQREITRSGNDADASFQVVAVARSNVAALAAWPKTGWHGHYHWFDKAQGPNSQVIQPGDTVILTVWDNDPSSLLTGPAGSASLPEMTVSPSGAVFVPYVGDIRVRGQSPDAARSRIQSELEAIAPSAQVQLNHSPGRRSAVDAVRGVANPGSYPLPDRNVSVLSLISLAGGISTDLRNPLIRLIRANETYEIRVKTLLENPRRNVTLRGGDQIIVDEDDRSFIALGATGKEEIVYFSQEHITALEALAEVGGLSDSRADLQGVLILREYPASALRSDASGPQKAQVVFTFDLTSAEGLFAARKFRVNPDDVVIASESPVTSARTVLGLIGSIVGVGGAINNVAN